MRRWRAEGKVAACVNAKMTARAGTNRMSEGRRGLRFRKRRSGLKNPKAPCNTLSCMTTTLTIRLSETLARELKAKTKAAKTSPSAVLRRAATDYVRERKTGPGLNAMQEHILARAGTWDGYCSGEELLRKTRP